MNLPASFVSTSPGALRLSPSKASPRGPTLRPYADYPHLLGSDPRRGTLFSGYGEVGVLSIAFVREEDCAPFGDEQHRAVAPDVVLCAIAKDTAPGKLSLPYTLASQTNLTFLIAIEGALGEAIAAQLAAIGSKIKRRFTVEFCSLEDLVHIEAPPNLDYSAPGDDLPPDEPPAVVAVEADTKRQVFDASFDVQTFEIDALLEASEDASSAIDDNHATQPDQHAPSSTAGAAPAEGVAAAVNDVARTIPENEEALDEEEENIRRSRCAARMDADQDASKPHLELSVGVGRPWFDEDGSIKKDERGRNKSPLDLEKVKPWVGTPRELHALLNSHRYASTNKGFKHKVGHFIVGAVFAGTEEHPTGHRHGDSLQHATLVLFDIDDAPNLTRAELEARLRSLGVGFIFYSTWSNARAGSGKTGLCARIVFWLTRPLTAPDDLAQALRVQSIGQQLAAIVHHLSTCLEIDSTKAVDEVSKRPHQLMYTPRGHDAGRSSPDCWWCEFHDGPALNPDSLPGGVSLAELLPPSAPQLADTDNPPSTPAPSVLPASSTAPTSTPSKTSPRTREGSIEAFEALRARGLAYIETCAEDLKSYTSGRYERITQHVGPRCGSIAAGHGLTEAEGLKPLADIVDSWGRPDLSKALRATFAHGYQDPRTLPESGPPRSPSKSSKKTAPPDLDTSSAAPSPASDAQPDAAQQHTEAASTAPQFIKGDPKRPRWITDDPRVLNALASKPQNERPGVALVTCPAALREATRHLPRRSSIHLYIDPQSPLAVEAARILTARECAFRNLYKTPEPRL